MNVKIDSAFIPPDRLPFELVELLIHLLTASQKMPK